MAPGVELFIDCRCALGEGAFWHPLLGRLFWFDIYAGLLLSATPDGVVVDRLQFEGMPSAAGVEDAEHLVVAFIDGFYRVSLATGRRELVQPLEPGALGRRSNDGRVDTIGGFWIGTMATTDEAVPSGNLYRAREGVVTRIMGDIRVPNGTAFSPDGRIAYFADSPTRTIRLAPIDPGSGLPVGPWADFAVCPAPNQPDGAVVDAAGFLWSAQWDGSAVVRYAPDGSVDRVVALPVSRPTCPAFGGDDLKTLYITSSRDQLGAERLLAEPLAGGIFSIRVDVPGLPETLVRL